MNNVGLKIWSGSEVKWRKHVEIDNDETQSETDEGSQSYSINIEYILSLMLQYNGI